MAEQDGKNTGQNPRAASGQKPGARSSAGRKPRAAEAEGTEAGRRDPAERPGMSTEQVATLWQKLERQAHDPAQASAQDPGPLAMDPTEPLDAVEQLILERINAVRDRVRAAEAEADLAAQASDPKRLARANSGVSTLSRELRSWVQLWKGDQNARQAAPSAAKTRPSGESIAVMHANHPLRLAWLRARDDERGVESRLNYVEPASAAGHSPRRDTEAPTRSGPTSGTGRRKARRRQPAGAA